MEGDETSGAAFSESVRRKADGFPRPDRLDGLLSRLAAYRRDTAEERPSAILHVFGTTWKRGRLRRAMPKNVEVVLAVCKR